MEKIVTSGEIYIFGAHSRARTFAEYYKKLYPDCSLLAYMFNNDEENPESVDGIPVIDLKVSNSSELKTDSPVFLAIKGVGVESVTEDLKRIGFVRIIPVDVELDMELRNRYLKVVFSEKGRPFLKIDSFLSSPNALTDDNGNDHIYVVSSAFDSKLKEHHEYLPFEKVIQVGTSLTENRLEGALYDNEGESISDKNTQFCELTALYWVWKNSHDDYVGIEHYRRFFVIGDDIFDVMRQNDIDVILPVPLCVLPSLKDNYLFRHENRPWHDMMSVLSEIHPEERETAEKFFDNSLYSPCNMIIARKEVFDRLCEWMFPILMEVNTRNGKFDDKYQNRYPGFLSERMISFFFELHREKYKCVYADKIFLA